VDDGSGDAISRTKLAPLKYMNLFLSWGFMVRETCFDVELGMGVRLTRVQPDSFR
jgi:hypothetical protein